MLQFTITHTHTHTYIPIYIYIIYNLSITEQKKKEDASIIVDLADLYRSILVFLNIMMLPP